jgi:Zn-dependent peptidase ImmA (M78 family)
MPIKETSFSKALVVWLILNQQVEEALGLLANEYKVDVPRLKVGLPKGHKKKSFGVYQSRDEIISVLNSDVLSNPFVILHEFYHHLRSKAVDKQHRGTEKNADEFALNFLTEFQTATARFTR